MDKSDNDTVYLVDGSGYIFRAYYAVRPLSSSKGVPTNAVYGFTNMLLKLIRDRNPKYFAIAFDTKEKNFRHKLYTDYKANRPPPPEDLIPQFDLIHQVVDAFNINRLVQVGYEADDLLGSAAKLAKQAGKKVVIVTGDKDLMQLVDADTFLLDELRASKTGSEEIVTEEEVEKKFGVRPNRVADILALAGDTSDNVPGVRGIGGKTAAALINEYGDLENLLNNIDGIKQNSRRQKLQDGIDSARLSKKLVDIDCDVDLGVSVDDLKWVHPGTEKLFTLFEELDFKRLQKDESLKNILSGDNRPQISEVTQEKKNKYEAIKTLNQLKEVLKEADNAEVIAIDTETNSLDAMQAQIVGLSLCFKAHEAYYLPLFHQQSLFEEQIKIKDAIALLNPLLTDPNKTIIAQNAKFDLKVLIRAGFKPFKVGGDPMLANYLLMADQARHGLDSLSERYLDHTPIPFEEVCGKGKKQITFDQVPLGKATDYAAEDADLALQLGQLLATKIKEENFEKLYYDLELPLEEVLTRIEMTGVKIDKKKLAAMSKDFEKKLVKLEQEAEKAAGKTFNLASPKQVGDILFVDLGLKAVKKTKTGFSTDSSVLEALSGEHELPRIILEHRMLSKLKGTYIDTLPELINPETGRVHTTFNQFVAATGRLSSSDPNLQNIPIRTKEGKAIRGAFIAEEGNLIASLDYSQIELRILAHVSGDPVMVDAFKNGEDIHQRTASEIFDEPLNNVSKEQRSYAKTINFGLLYGMGVHRLSQTLGIPRTEAKAYLDKYYERYQGIFKWQEKLLEEARAKGEVRTLLGRKRLVPEINAKNRMLAQRAERIAINTPIQGSAADIIKLAMIEVDKVLSEKHPTAKMILQVHDELLIEAPEKDIESAKCAVQEIMTEVYRLSVPLVVDGEIGKSWNEAH